MSVQPRVAFGTHTDSHCGDSQRAAADGVTGKLQKRILWEARFLKKAGFPHPSGKNFYT